MDAGAGSGDFLLEAAEAARVAGVGFYGLWEMHASPNYLNVLEDLGVVSTNGDEAIQLCRI